MTAFEMFAKNFTGAGRAEQRKLLNETLAQKLILEIAKGEYSDLYKSKMLKAILWMELDKDTPDPEIVQFATKHLNPLVDRMILKGVDATTTSIEFTDAELAIVEQALKKEME